MAGDTQYSLHLLGPFRLSRPEGQRVAISSKKGRALLAMLAMADDGERSRTWLQDKLWGSRQPPQARNSLRRELSELRKLLNVGPDVLLLCARDHVRLDLARFSIDARANAPIAHGEFLEGLDIPGEEAFEEWLREQRRLLARSIAEPSSPNSPDFPLSSGVQGFEGRPALAVLRFLNLTDDAANDYLAEGLSEDLIDQLSRLRWLPVIARGSSFSVASDDRDLKLIGQALRAKYLLEGRLRGSNPPYWLSASLSDSETGYVLWSERVSLPAPSSPEAAETLVSGLVSVLDTRIDHAEQERARAKHADSLDVHDLIWRGRWHLNRFTRADSRLAHDFFAKALELAPNSAEALIQATFCLAWSLWAERRSDAEILEMRKLSQRAMVADPDDGRSYMLAGIAEMWLRRSQHAKALLERALTLNPSLALAHAELGSYHNLAGDPSASIAPLDRAMRLSPNDPHSFYPLGELAIAHCMLGNWDQAVNYANQAIVRRPAYWYAHMVKVTALGKSGNLDAATQAYRELMSVKPGFDMDYVHWLPFVDRSWTRYFADGVVMAAETQDARRA